MRPESSAAEIEKGCGLLNLAKNGGEHMPS
jgi:hypothetical protein